MSTTAADLADDLGQEQPPIVAQSQGVASQHDEFTRVKIFLGIQILFLILSGFTGGFQFKWWSMLDSALLIWSIGITAMVVVLEPGRWRRRAFATAIILYLAGLFDMGLNVLISGVVGWRLW